MSSKITDTDWITHCVEKGVWLVSQVIDHQLVCIKLAATPKPIYKIFNITDCKKYERTDFEEDPDENEALQSKVNAWINKFTGVKT